MPNYRPIESYYRTGDRYTWTDPLTGEEVESTMRPPMAEPALPPSAIADVISQRGRVWTTEKALEPLRHRREEGPIYEYFPTETAGIPDLRSISFERQPEDVSGLIDEIDNLIEADYEAGKATHIRRLSDNMKIANEVKDVNPEMHQIMVDEFNAVFKAGNAELEMDYSNVKRKRKQVWQNINLNPSQRVDMFGRFYENNRVFEPPTIRRPTRPEAVGAPLAPGALEKRVGGRYEAPTMAGYIESVWDKPWARNRASQGELIEAFKGWALDSGFAAQRPAVKQQLIRAWEDLVRDYENTEWNPESPEVQNLYRELAMGRVSPPSPSPYPEYPDAFQEEGVWKLIRDGKKYRIEP